MTAPRNLRSSFGTTRRLVWSPPSAQIPAMVSTFDTLEIAKRLKNAGFGDAQAEALTGVLRETRDGDLSRIATKEDLLATKDDLTSAINSLHAEMEIMRRDLTIRPGGMIVVATGILLAAKFFG
jgi:hypothetical protein